jgi:hypothetical protein
MANWKAVVNIDFGINFNIRVARHSERRRSP